MLDPIALPAVISEPVTPSANAAGRPCADPLTPDTALPMTAGQMAEAFDRLGPPPPVEDAELSGDPDDYPLF